MKECDCYDAKACMILSNRAGIRNIKVMCGKCELLWHINENEAGEIESYTKEKVILKK